MLDCIMDNQAGRPCNLSDAQRADLQAYLEVVLTDPEVFRRHLEFLRVMPSAQATPLPKFRRLEDLSNHDIGMLAINRYAAEELFGKRFR